MKKTEKVKNIIEILKAKYPEVKCFLTYTHPYELLIAARLSAQCTDKRVNLVTPKLFERFDTIDKFADADVEEIKAAKEKLMTSAQGVFTKMYEQAAAQQQGGPTPEAGPAPEGFQGDDVVDGDYKEV